MPDTFFSNRLEDIEQLKYLLTHKYRIYKAGRQLGVPRLQLLKHDITKFLPREWVPYREHFFDDPNVEDIRRFREAVILHKRTPHHQGTAPLEAVADWYAAGKKKQIPFKQWVKENMKTFPLTEETKEVIMGKLGTWIL